jgi:Ca2+-binding EF-hand superfamily protein
MCPGPFFFGANLFMRITKSGFESLIKHEAAYAWSRYDRDNSACCIPLNLADHAWNTANNVGLEEIETVLLETLKKMPDEDVRKLAQDKLTEWDTNGDGKVTLAEFAEYVLRCVATGKDPWEFLEE